jgi:hypothetical protein
LPNMTPLLHTLMNTHNFQVFNNSFRYRMRFGLRLPEPENGKSMSL